MTRGLERIPWICAYVIVYICVCEAVDTKEKGNRMCEACVD